MLRALVVVLLLANAAVLAWNLGALDGLLGRRPDAEREPERLQRQVNPELVKLLPPPGASAPAVPASPVTAASSPVVPVMATGPAAPLCLEAGPLPATALPGAERALLAAGVRAGSWSTTATDRKGVFLIYMGRYEDDETLQRKLEELKRRRIESQPVRHAELQPGIEVARFDDKDEAEAALARLSQRGLRTARVLTLVQPQLMLRLAAAEPGEADALAQLKLAPNGSGFTRCATLAESAPTGARAITVAASAPSTAAAVPAALGSAARPAASRPRPAVSAGGNEAASSTAAPASPTARSASPGSAAATP